jgi:hypothetical protein
LLQIPSQEPTLLVFKETRYTKGRWEYKQPERGENKKLRKSVKEEIRRQKNFKKYIIILL